MMPVYTIETPGGRRLKIEAADEAAAMRGAQEWHAAQGQGEQPQQAQPPIFPARTGGMDPDLRMRRTFDDIGMPDQSLRSTGSDLLASELSGQGAAEQGTSPFLAGRQSLGEVEQYDFGPAYHDESGAVRAVNPGDEVVLNDPQTNRPSVYPRTEGTDESGLMGLSRLFLGGVAAGAPTRVAGGVASGAARASPRAAQVVQAFDRSGVDPSLLTALENRAFKYAGEAVRNVPGGGAIQRSIQRQTTQAGQRAEEIADSLTDVGDAATAGSRVRTGAREFAETLVPQRQGQLYDVAENLVGPSAMSTLSATRKALAEIGGQIQNPALRELLTDPNFQHVAKAIQSTEGLSFSDLRQLRTMLRGLKPAQDSKVGLARTTINRVYDALTSDMHTLARTVGGEPGERALRLADDFTRRMMGDDVRAGVEAPVNIVKRLITDKSDEQIFQQLVRWAGKGAGAYFNNLTAVRKFIPAENWGSFVGAFIRNMGKPRAGQQVAADASEWSPATFMTTYENLSKAGRTLLFSGEGNSQLRSALDDLLVVAGNLKNNARFGNPSGSAAHFIQYATPVALYAEPFSTLSILGTAATASRIMTSPRLVRWITGAYRAARSGSAPLWQNHMRSLSQVAANDNQIIEPLARFAEQLRQIGRPEPSEDTRRTAEQR